jgi:hypothetical protein
VRLFVGDRDLLAVDPLLRLYREPDLRLAAVVASDLGL